jgi:hypothetical protein
MNLTSLVISRQRRAKSLDWDDEPAARSGPGPWLRQEEVLLRRVTLSLVSLASVSSIPDGADSAFPLPGSSRSPPLTDKPRYQILNSALLFSIFRFSPTLATSSKCGVLTRIRIPYSESIIQVPDSRFEVLDVRASRA